MNEVTESALLGTIFVCISEDCYSNVYYPSMEECDPSDFYVTLLGELRGHTTPYNITNIDANRIKLVPLDTIKDEDVFHCKLAGEWNMIVERYDKL